MSHPPRHKTLLLCGFPLLFSGVSLWGQLNTQPSITTPSGTGPEVIHCNTDPFTFSLQTSPTSSNDVFRYRYVRSRGGLTFNLTLFTTSTTVDQDDFLDTLEDEDEIFAEVYVENSTGGLDYVDQTNRLQFRLVDPPEVAISHNAQSSHGSAYFCVGSPIAITVAPTRLQPGHNLYSFYVDNVLIQGPSDENIFNYSLSRNSSVTIRVSNACDFEKTLSFYANGVDPGKIETTATHIVNHVSATHTGGVPAAAHITYEWESSLDQTNWSSVLNRSSSTLEILDFEPVTYYRRVAISALGDATCIDYSNTVVITPPEQIEQTSFFQCPDNAFPELTILETSTRTIEGYQWQSSLDDGVTYTNIPDATNSYYQPPKANWY